MTKGQSDTTQPMSTRENILVVIGLGAILLLITWIGLSFESDSRSSAWFLILALMSLFAVAVGRGITRHWRGIFIDNRNKMSLSRFQLVVWTLVVLSALVTAVLGNVAIGWQSPLEIDIPSQLWVLMGISTASAVGSRAVLTSIAQNTTESDVVISAAATKRQVDGANVDAENVSIVVRNLNPTDARWSDLLKGDEVYKLNHVDVGKLQMFFFTFILVVGYGAAIASLFDGDWPVTRLPAVQDGMNVLLGISHTGYLASKAADVQRKPGT